jgi:hypothetical protein
MKIVLRRGTSPEAVDMIKPYLLPDEDMNQEQMIVMLKSGLIEYPRLIHLLIAYDQDTEHVLGFFLTIWQPPAKYTFVTQAWCRSEVAEHITPTVWAKIQAWTESLGLSKIRAETWRGDALIRKYKFKEVSRTVEYILPGAEPVEEIIHGKDEEPTKEHVNAVEGSAGSRGGPEELLGRDVQPGSDSVSGELPGGDAAAVRDSDGSDQSVSDGASAGTTESERTSSDTKWKDPVSQ